MSEQFKHLAKALARRAELNRQGYAVWGVEATGYGFEVVKLHNRWAKREAKTKRPSVTLTTEEQRERNREAGKRWRQRIRDFNNDQS